MKALKRVVAIGSVALALTAAPALAQDAEPAAPGGAMDAPARPMNEGANRDDDFNWGWLGLAGLLGLVGLMRKDSDRDRDTDRHRTGTNVPRT